MIHFNKIGQSHRRFAYFALRKARTTAFFGLLAWLVAGHRAGCHELPMFGHLPTLNKHWKLSEQGTNITSSYSRWSWIVLTNTQNGDMLSFAAQKFQSNKAFEINRVPWSDAAGSIFPGGHPALDGGSSRAFRGNWLRNNVMELSGFDDAAKTNTLQEALEYTLIFEEESKSGPNRMAHGYALALGELRVFVQHTSIRPITTDEVQGIATSLISIHAARKTAFSPSVNSSGTATGEDPDILDLAKRKPLQVSVAGKPAKFGDPQLAKAIEALTDLPRPCTVPATIKIFEQESRVWLRKLKQREDEKNPQMWAGWEQEADRCGHFAILLASSRDPRAAVALCRTLDNPTFPGGIRVSEGLYNYFLSDARFHKVPPEQSGVYAGTSSYPEMIRQVKKWWALNKSDLEMNPLRVIVKPSKTEVRAKESFKVALRVENLAGTNQTVRVMNCSWDEHWTTSNTNITWLGWDCAKNFAVTVEIAPGGAYTNQMEMFVLEPIAQDTLSFQVGFTPIDVTNTVWSEKVVLNVIKPNFKPKNGYVPDAEAAIRIAVAVWEAIYGEEKIAREKPYRARLTSGVWIVEGSLPAGSVGGVAIAEIAKDDGRILRVIHEQ